MKLRYYVKKSMRKINNNLIKISNNLIMKVNNQKNLLNFWRLM